VSGAILGTFYGWRISAVLKNQHHLFQAVSGTAGSDLGAALVPGLLSTDARRPALAIFTEKCMFTDEVNIAHFCERLAS